MVIPIKFYSLCNNRVEDNVARLHEVKPVGEKKTVKIREDKIL